MDKAFVETNAHAGLPLRVGIWIAQYLIAFVFLSAGFMKTTVPLPSLVRLIPWTADAPEWFVRTIGIVDLTGGIGLLLPAWTRIFPRLGVLAALGCTTVLALAVAFHAYRGELLGVSVNFPLLAVSAFVFWGRGKRVPIPPRRSFD